MTPEAAIALAAATSAAISWGAALLLRRGAFRFGLVDPPGERKLQRHPVPLVGFALWVALFFAHLLGTWGGGDRFRDAFAIAWATPFLCHVVGDIDDWRAKGLGPGTKLSATAVALLPAFLVAATSAGGVVAPALLGFALLALVVIHAANTVDHSHGLCGLVAAVGGGAVAWSAFAAGRFTAALDGAAIGAAALGFLLHNYPHGRVFLGDGGSLLLGGCLAAALLLEQRCEWLLLAAVPLADLASVALLRLKLGVAPWRGDRRHVTHRLAARGVREPVAVALLALLQAGCSAWAAPRLFAPPAEGAWLAVAGVIGALALGMLCIPLPREPATRAAS